MGAGCGGSEHVLGWVRTRVGMVQNEVEWGGVACVGARVHARGCGCEWLRSGVRWGDLQVVLRITT